MEIEDRGDQQDRQHQATDDAPAQLEPHREECDLLAEALPLDIAPIEIIWHKREQRAKHQLKHGRVPPSSGYSERPTRSCRVPSESRRQPFLSRVLPPCPRSSQPIRRCCSAAYQSREGRSARAGARQSRTEGYG